MAEGHRARLRQRFIHEDIDEIPEYVVLEMILTGVVKRQDTCQIARDLIQTFGSLAKVIDAPSEELLKLDGIGESIVTYLKLLPQFYRKYRLSKWSNNLIFTDSNGAGDYLADKFIGHKTEVIFVLCMDSNCRVLCCKKASEGNINAVQVNIRNIVDITLKYNASRAIIAHNHISGNALPSSDDLATTTKIRDALQLVGVHLDDHIIVADDDYVSLAQSGFFANG